MGLSIIYAIVRNHDGEITVASEQDVGTVFRVILPVIDESANQWSSTTSLDSAFAADLHRGYTLLR